MAARSLGERLAAGRGAANLNCLSRPAQWSMMDAVNDADWETWAAIDRGERQIDWGAWFGDPDGADYLTAEGKRVARRAVADLTVFFGPAWLNRALNPEGSHRPRIPGLGGSAPTLAWTAARRPGAFIESLRWWASLQLLVEDRVPGFEVVRRDARNDLSTHRLTHALTQARLAAIGTFIGAGVEVEPGKAGGPGDVLLHTGQQEVFLEIVTFGPDENRELDESHQHRHMMHLIGLAAKAIYWEGSVPGFLNPADEARWVKATAEAAAQCEQAGQAVEIPGPHGQNLVVRPGVAPAGTRLTGPELSMDFSARLGRILDKKGSQTRGAGIAWIWVEDHGGVHAVHPFTRMPIAVKATSLAGLAGEALADRPHVAGIIWSGVTRCSQLPPDEDAQTPAGLAFQRALPIEHVRQTVIVSRHLVLPDQLRILGQLCDREPQWLDWALRRLGVNGGTRSLLAQPSPPRTSLLWTPSSRS